MTRTIFILNGPNLNLLGKRQPQIYGRETLADVEGGLTTLAGELGLELRFLQSNWEGQIVDWIHEAINGSSGVIINPAAYTHTSVAILDALKMVKHPIIELHISNPHQREEFRHRSFVTPVATATIAGLGTDGYAIAIDGMAALLARWK